MATKVKLYVERSPDHEVRRFDLDTDATGQQLRQRIESLLGFADFRIEWQDEEGDMIVLDSPDELMAARELVTGSDFLHLFVHPRTTTPESQATIKCTKCQTLVADTFPDCLYGSEGAKCRLYPGERIYSPDRTLQLVMQEDGNLVLYRRSNSERLWATGHVIHGRSGDKGSVAARCCNGNTEWESNLHVVMQGDGNLVIYCHGVAMWASATNYCGQGCVLRLRNDGNLVIYGPGGQGVWASDATLQIPAHESDTLRSGEKLLPGQYLRTRSGNAELIMQTDGNLVLYRRNKSPIWSSRTPGQRVRECVMQPDGNLVVYDMRGYPLWASNTTGKPGSLLKIQDDGNMCIYQDNNCTWSSRICGS